MFFFLAWGNGKWSSWLTVSVKIEILNPQPPPKKAHTTHTQSTHPHVCASHMGGRETRNETMELAVCNWTFICLLSFLYPWDTLKKRKRLAPARYLARLPQNTTYLDAPSSNKIINKSCLCTITDSEVIKQVNHPPMREEGKIIKVKV